MLVAKLFLNIFYPILYDFFFNFEKKISSVRWDYQTAVTAVINGINYNTNEKTKKVLIFAKTLKNCIKYNKIHLITSKFF